MNKQSIRRAALAAACAVFLAACDPTPTPSTGSSSCPPIGAPIVATVSASDVSGVTVPSGATAELDSGGFWCGSPALAVNKVNVNSLISSHGCFNNRSDTTPPCLPYSALAAVDVKPDGVGFPSFPRAQLRYDLDVSPPVCEGQPTGCGGFSIYQLISPIPTPPALAWDLVGYASQTSFGGKTVAEGDIDHFSVFALVELPQPNPIPGPQVAFIASDFLEMERSEIGVLLRIEDSEALAPGESRLVRFAGVDPAFDDTLPAECLALPGAPEQLSCLLPINTLVLLELPDENTVIFENLDRGYVVQFFVAAALIH